jgi:hypothetical protein
VSGNVVAAVYQLLREVADRVVAHDDQFKAIRTEWPNFAKTSLGYD